MEKEENDHSVTDVLIYVVSFENIKMSRSTFKYRGMMMHDYLKDLLCKIVKHSGWTNGVFGRYNGSNT